MTIRTPRLILTRITRADLPDIERMHSDPRVMATLGGVRSAEECERFVDASIAHWEEHGFGLWIARDGASGCFAGRGGLRWVCIGGRNEVEVAYAIATEFWGRGLATELARASVRVGFGELCRPSLVCFTWLTNGASRRVMEKAGFRYERSVTHAGLPHALHRLYASAWRPAS